MKDKAVLILAELLLTADIIKDLKEHKALFLSVSNLSCNNNICQVGIN